MFMTNCSGDRCQAFLNEVLVLLYISYLLQGPGLALMLYKLFGPLKQSSR